MPRLCGLCRHVLRWDDQLEFVQTNAEEAAPPAQSFIVGFYGVIPQGTMSVMACPRCVASLEGREPPEPRIWPVGKQPPFKTGNPMTPCENIDVCGVCRLALFEDDKGDLMRLAAEDVRLVNALREKQGRQPIKPGSYFACRDCIARWKPTIHARLKANPPLDSSGRNRLDPVKIPALAEFGGNWLM